MTDRQFNLADLFELVVDTVPDRLALVAGDVRLTYASSTPGPTASPTTSPPPGSAQARTWGSSPATGPNGSRP